MRRNALILLTLALLLGCALTLAETTCTDDGFEYALLPDGSAELIRYTGEDGEVIIPKALDGHPVTAVRGNPFFYRYTWDDYGVRDCRVSVSVEHPYLATIDGVLFGKTDKKLIYCPPSRAGEYAVPQGILEIGERAFNFCGKLTGVTIPDSVTAIGDNAFLNCSGLAAVTFGDGLTRIGDHAFYDCDSLARVSLPDTVTEIGDYAFSDCKNLAEVKIPAGLTKLNFSVFFLSGLTGVTIPDSVTFIDGWALASCFDMTDAVIPDSVTEIGAYAFYYDKGLTEVVIPDSVTSIGDFAFCYCESLRSVKLPASLERIGEHAFDLENWSADTGEDEYGPNPYLVFTVTPGSYAEDWCRENGLQYVSADGVRDDRHRWLTGP